MKSTFFNLRNILTKSVALILWVSIIAVLPHHRAHSAMPVSTNETIPAGSIVIDMGKSPQTTGNGLKPYGLVYALVKNLQVPVEWIINTSKGKDGIDFTGDGISFRGAPFIIKAEYVTPAVLALVNTWEGMGVVTHTLANAAIAPVYITINFVPGWTLDEGNGGIAENYITAAGIPESAYNWKDPQALNCCDDIFVMPHADPEWSTHSNLLQWNLTCKGGIWAACHAVSALELMFNPANPTQQTNFLSTKTGTAQGGGPYADPSNSLVLWGDHGEGDAPYSYFFPTAVPMQFLGDMDDALQSGSEQSYLPVIGAQWRPTTQVGVSIPNHPDFPSLSLEPAKVIFGQAFGDPNRGKVMYEAGHTHAGSSPDNVAAQRAFLNFSFWAAADNAIKVTVAGVTPTAEGGNDVMNLTANATGGTGNFTFEWVSDCPGTFSNPNGATTTFTPTFVNEGVACSIKCIVKDDCGTRTAFSSSSTTIVPAPQPPVANNDDKFANPGVAITFAPLSNDTDLNLDIDPSSLKFWDSVGSTSLGNTFTTSNNGTFTINFDGTVTYQSDPGFIGTETIDYQICDETTPADGGPFCDEATITIVVDQTDEFGCSPAETYSKIYTGYGALESANAFVGNGFFALGYPEGLSINKAAALDANSTVSSRGSITITLDNSILEGGKLTVHGWAQDGNPAEFTVETSADGITFSNAQNFTAPNKDQAYKFEYTVQDPDGAIFVRVTSNSSSKDFLLDGISYDVKDCRTNCVLPFVDLFLKGTANAVFAGDAKDMARALGYPDFTQKMELDVLKFAVLDLTDVIPAGESIQLFLANDSQSPEPSINVTGSLDGVTFTNLQTFTPTTDKDESYGQYFYTAGGSGVRYIRFEGVGGKTFIDAVVYDISTCESGVPVAVNDVTYTLEGVPTTYPVQVNDIDPQGDKLTTTQITSTPSSGTATINPDGTITYVPNTEFNGTDVLTYEVCDENGLCTTATLTIIIPDDGCADPGQTLQKVGESYAIAATDPGNNVNNEALATYYPSGSGFAEMDNPNEELILQLSEVARAGTKIRFFASSDGAQVDFTVKVSTDGVSVNAIDAVTYSVTGTSFQEFEYLVNSPNIDFIHFINNDLDDRLRIDGVIFDIYACAPNCVAPNKPILNDGFAVSATGARDPLNAVGTPNVVAQEIRLGDIVTIVDLGQVVPQGAKVYIYAANNGATQPLRVQSSSTNGSYANLSTISVTNTTGYLQYVYTVTAAAGIRYLELGVTSGDRVFIDAVSYYYTICQDATPVAVNDATFTTEEVPVTYAVLNNDTDPGGLPLSTVQITSGPSNGSAVINPDGTITYTPNPEFTGPDQLTYQTCNPLGLCATAVLTITVADDGCAPGESKFIVGTGYAAIVGATLSVNNSANAIGVPDGIMAEMDNGNEYLVLNLNNTVAPGEDICFYVAGEAGKTTTFNVSFSNNGTQPGSNSVPFSVSGATLQKFCTTLNFAGGASFIHFTNTSTVANENLSVDGVEYNIKACVPTGCLVPEEALTKSGFATDIDISSTATDPFNATGAPNKVGSQVASGQFLVVDLGQEVPAGTIIFFYVGSGGGTTVSVTTSTTTTFSGAGTAYSVAVATPNYRQRSITVGAGGARYVRFNATNGNVLVDAVEFSTYLSNSVAGYVWDDSNNENGTFEQGTENAFANVDVKIYEDNDNDGTVSAGDVLLSTESTDANGFWSYNFFASSLPLNVVMQVDEATLPSTPTNNYYTTAKYQTATLTTPSDSDCDNNFGRAFDNPPVAQDDAATTEQNTPITINLIGNDTNPDVDGEVTTVTAITSAPSAGGSVSINPDGTANYTPPVGFVGTEVFSYSLCDQADPGVLCDVATVTVTVTPFVNDPPVATNDNATTEQDKPISINVLGNDSDPEGSNISPPKCVGTDASSATPTTCDGLTAQGGTVTILPSGEIYYVPPAGYTGPDQVTYVICDPQGLCDEAVINITVTAPVNDPPIAADDEFNVYVPCGATVLNVVENDFDPDGSINPASVTITSPLSPNVGTLTNNFDGTFSYTAASAGTFTFEYQVCDDGVPSPVLCDVATVTIVVPASNSAPVATDDFDDLFSGQTVTTPVLANDSDPEGDNLLVTLCSGNATGCGLTTTTSTQGGTVTVQPSGKIEYVPTPGFTGVDTYFYQVCDDGCPTLCDQATVTITLNNQAPVARDDAEATAINIVKNIAVLPNDFDPEGGTITVTSAGTDPNSPSGNLTTQGGSVSILPDGTIDYTPPVNFIGQDTFYYQICDDNTFEQKCDVAEVVITITSPIDINIAKSVFPTDPNAGDNVTYTLTISNTSTGTATGVVVKDKLPSGLTYVSDTGNGAYDEATGIWSVGTIASGGSKTLQIVATVVNFNDIVNVAEVTKHNEVDVDSTPNNNASGEDDQSAVILQCTLKYGQIGVTKN